MYECSFYVRESQKNTCTFKKCTLCCSEKINCGLFFSTISPYFHACGQSLNKLWKSLMKDFFQFCSQPVFCHFRDLFVNQTFVLLDQEDEKKLWYQVITVWWEVQQFKTKLWRQMVIKYKVSYCPEEKNMSFETVQHLLDFTFYFTSHSNLD